MLYAKKLSAFSSVQHGFTTKKDKVHSIIKKAYQGEQVHGSIIKKIKQGSPFLSEKADGLISLDQRAVLAARTADCVPILLFDPENSFLGTVHAGWLGTRKKIIQKAIRKLINEGSKVSDIRIAIGPSIGPCCYDVFQNRAHVFKRKWPKTVKKRNEKWYLDLKEVNRLQCREVNISNKNIEVLEYCTYCQKDLFYSYRRDKSVKNVMYAFIGLK